MIDVLNNSVIPPALAASGFLVAVKLLGPKP